MLSTSVSKMSDNEHSFPMLWNSEVLAVKHLPFDRIPQLCHSGYDDAKGGRTKGHARDERENRKPSFDKRPRREGKSFDRGGKGFMKNRKRDRYEED